MPNIKKLIRENIAIAIVLFLSLVIAALLPLIAGATVRVPTSSHSWSQTRNLSVNASHYWIPAYAGMTNKREKGVVV
ncbi:MAG: hypothetical protein AAB553_04450 [Patescibacteria group bacterium]